MASVCKKAELGSLPFGVPEFKVEWEGHPIPHPVAWTRESKVTAYAEFCGLDNVINDSWNDIRMCAISAAGVAAVAAIIGDPPAALPAFKAAFLACVVVKIGDTAKQLGVGLSTQQSSGDWHKV
jgi:hypothetical protein